MIVSDELCIKIGAFIGDMAIELSTIRHANGNDPDEQTTIDALTRLERLCDSLAVEAMDYVQEIMRRRQLRAVKRARNGDTRSSP